MPKNLPTVTRLNGLDHLRALAITLVFFYHYRMFGHPAWINNAFELGWTGVDLFFVLSGYLISTGLFKEIDETASIEKKKFFIKRFFRIIPPFLAVLTLYFAVPAFREREALPPLWKFLTFTQNFGLDVIHFGTFSHAWSLCIEEQFYILLPFILLMLYRGKKWRCGPCLVPVLLVGVLLFRLLSWYVWIEPHAGQNDFALQWYKYMYYPTFTRLDGLLVGVGIASVMRYRSTWRSKVHAFGNGWLAAVAVAMALSLFLSGEQISFFPSIFGFSVVAIICGLLVLAAISKRSVLSRTPSFITTQLASLSYAVYLSHKGVIHITQSWLQKTGVDMNGATMMFACIFSCLAAAFILRYLVERPALHLRDYFLHIANSLHHFSRLARGGHNQ